MKNLALLFACFAVSAFAVGCTNDDGTGNGTDNGNNSNETNDKDDHDGHDHADHDHKPKHGGHLIEIGRDHKYHAELVDDHKTESVTVYMMDGDMEPLTIKQSSISLVLTSDDKTQTFELMATQPGGSSEFSSNDAKMMEMIDGEDVTGKLRINIDGKPVSGSFDHHAHGHDGDGDDHGHDH